MGDLAVQECDNSISKHIGDLVKELVEVTGISIEPTPSGDSSDFELIWSVIEQEHIGDIISLIENESRTKEDIDILIKKIRDRFFELFNKYFNDK